MDSLMKSLRIDGRFDALIQEIKAEAARALRKHGFTNTPAWPSMPNNDRFVIVAEEFGEVARALTYDEGSQDGLRKELIQLATMALMWVDGLDSMLHNKKAIVEAVIKNE